MAGSLDGLVEVVDTQTGLVQRVPADWLDNPRTGRFFEKTLAQQALDGELPPLPSDAKLADLRDYATAAGLDVEGASTKADFQALLEPVTAVPGDEDTDDADGSGDDEGSDQGSGEAPNSDGGNAGDPSNPNPPAAGDNNPS